MKVLLVICLILPFISGAMLAGGISSYSTTLEDPNVIFAVNGINEYFKGLGDNADRTAVKLISASSQVVSGAMYRYKIQVTGGAHTEVCDVAVWSRPWLTGSDALQISGEPSCNEAPTARANLLGGATEIGQNDADVQNVLAALEQRVNAQSNSLSYLKFTTAQQVTKQVVNGFLYHIKNLNFYASSCSKLQASADSTQCTLNANSQPMTICSADVWDNPRQTPQYQISNLQCSSAPVARAQLGGPDAKPLSDPEVQRAYAVLEQRVNAQSNDLMQLQADPAQTVTAQVVNGINYNFVNLNFYKSTCTKLEAAPNSNKVCTIADNSTPTTVCTATVWYNPRQTPEYQITAYQCA